MLTGVAVGCCAGVAEGTILGVVGAGLAVAGVVGAGFDVAGVVGIGLGVAGFVGAGLGVIGSGSDTFVHFAKSTIVPICPFGISVILKVNPASLYQPSKV